MKVTIKNIYLLLLVLILMSFVGCKSLIQNGEKPENIEPKKKVVNPCTPNLTKTGNFFKGTVYKCFKDYPNISKRNAFDKILSSMSMDGYNINNSNKELGLISATLPVIGGKGQTVPMNVMINEGSNKTVKVSTTINLTGGLVTGRNEIANYFCTVYKALEN